MIDILIYVSSLLLLIGGIAGCVLPILPGAPLAYAGLLLLHFTDKACFSTTQLISWLIIVVILQVIDYITPLLGSKYSGGTDFGNRDFSVQFSRSVTSDSMRPHESQHARPPCPSSTPGVHSDSRPSSP